MWELDHKESWVLKNWWFWTMVLGRLLIVCLTERRSNQSILKEISPKCSLERLILKVKLQYFGHHLMWRTDSLEKTLSWERLKAGGEGDDRGWDSGWQHQLKGHEFKQTLGDGDGQGSLGRCNLRGQKKSDTTEQLNWINDCSFGYQIQVDISQSFISNPHLSPKLHICLSEFLFNCSSKSSQLPQKPSQKSQSYHF